MHGIGVERDVGHDAQFGKPLAQGADNGGHEAFGVVGFFGGGGFVAGNDGKQREHGNAEFDGFFGGKKQFVEALAFHAGHGRDVFFLSAAFEYEHRVNQVVGGKRVFAHEAAGEVVFAHAAHAGGGNVTRRKIHRSSFCMVGSQNKRADYTPANPHGQNLIERCKKISLRNIGVFETLEIFPHKSLQRVSGFCIVHTFAASAALFF
ncbi:hypothetical protein HMPREF9120_02168, partial [Neisseria sp. oral taxon 020 str. F0370]